MHARNRTWPLGQSPEERCRQRILPIEGGDGSTLTLDFTTGVLDPRLSFTRLSDATFINSSGLVQWAAANHIRNSVFSGPATPTSWSLVAGGAGLTIPSDGVRRAVTTTGATNFINSAAMSTVVGQVYATTANILEVSGQHYRDTLEITASATILKYYRNGVEVASGASGQFNTAQAGLITVVWIATSATAHLMRLGVGCTGGTVTNGVAMFELPHVTPVFFPGTTTANSPSTYAAPAYVPNTNTGAAYQAPRFDHDPTTGTLKGLLIEGSAVNDIRDSNAIYITSLWGSSTGVTATQDTGIADPSNGTTTCKIVKAATYQYVVRNQTLPTLTVPANSTVNLTASVWLRMDGANQVAASLGIYDAAGASFGTRSGASVSNSSVTISSGSSADADFTFGTVTGWVRCSISRSFTNSTGSPVTFSQLGFYIYPNRQNTNATTIYAWGAQVESGVGLSSLIPTTGSSTGSRTADVCYMANADYGFSTSGGTYLAEWHRGFLITTAGGGTNAFSTDYASGRWLGIYTTGASSTGTAGSWAGYLNSSGAVSGINKMAVSYSSWISTASGNASLNGGAIVSGTLTLGTTPTYLFVGAASGTSPYSGGGYRDPLNNCVRRIKYWPSVLPNAQLQSLTT
jgi:hypothetical protein